MSELNYTRADKVKVREYQGDEVLEVRIHYGSCDEIIGYVYGDFYDKTWKVFDKYAKSLGGELSESVIENDDKYETFRALAYERN